MSYKPHKPRTRSLPPSRALLATLPDGRKATATWVKTAEGWRCLSASKPLRWMRGMRADEVHVPTINLMTDLEWHWIVPSFGRVVEPPFKG